MSTDHPNPTASRVLVFVHARDAAMQIVATLDRIPRKLFNADDVHILCIDDGSSDRTSEVAAEWVKQNAYQNVSILRNPVTLGYGGNQKMGYRLAIEWGFDAVIPVLANGRYAPEMIPLFIDALSKAGCDVVIGAPARESKPLLRRILTRVQNRLCGQRLSEWHSGYRAFSTRLLRRVPFEINSNDAHFDTELLLQATYVDARFTEIPIPGEDSFDVNVSYARDVLLESLRFRMHRMGAVCSLKYQQLLPSKYRSKVSMRYTSHSMALKRVRALSPKTLVDIGCGPGHVAQECQALGIEVTGIDVAEPLPGTMAHFRRCNLEQDKLPVDVFSYDAAILLDVIEHLENPENFLLELRNASRHISPSGEAPRLILSTPNIAFLFMRLNLLLGRFNYAERGILDIGHKRLFTKSSLLRLLSDCGYRVERIEPVPAPFEVVMEGGLGRILGFLASVSVKVWPRLFAFQWLVVCRPKPGINHLLAVTERPLVAKYPLPTNDQLLHAVDQVQ